MILICALCIASTEVKWSNGKAEVCYRVEAMLMGAESVMVCCCFYWLEVAVYMSVIHRIYWLHYVHLSAFKDSMTFSYWWCSLFLTFFSLTFYFDLMQHMKLFVSYRAFVLCYTLYCVISYL